jgi:two-component system sensor histidine kinase FlrB
MSAVPSHSKEGLEGSYQQYSQPTQSSKAGIYSLEDRNVRLHAELQQALQQNSQLQQQQVQTNEHLYRVIQALPAGVIVLDANGRVQEYNPAADRLLGQPLAGELWREVVKRCFAPQHDDGHEVSLVNGRRVSVSTCPLGEDPGQLLLLNDVTETRRLQERLGHQKRLVALGEMAASLAHQVRTPLAAAILGVSQLKNPNLDECRRSKSGDKILGSLRQLETLVNDMLMFSRAGYTGEQPFTLPDLLDGLIGNISQQVEGRGVDFKVDCEVGDCTLLGNQHLLQSAIQNLANNAIQALHKHDGQMPGQLILRVQSASINTIDISVMDNGPGIDAELRDKIFEPFFTTRSNGTGLGLAVVQAIVRAHRGEIWLEPSTTQGSVFVMRLPTVQ